MLSLLAAVALQTSAPVIVPPGGGDDLDLPFHPVRLILSGAASEGGVTFYEFTVPAKSAGGPPHVHTEEDEYFYVLEGAVTLMNGEELTVAEPGTLAAMTRGHQHAFWNAGDVPARMLAVVSGENRFEPFFDAIVQEMRDDPPAGPDAFGAVLGRVAAEHGIEMRPSALPAEARPYFVAPE